MIVFVSVGNNLWFAAFLWFIEINLCNAGHHFFFDNYIFIDIIGKVLY